MDKYLKQYLDIIQTTKTSNTYMTYANVFKLWFPEGIVKLDLDYVNQKIQSWVCCQNTLSLRCRCLKRFINFYSHNHLIENYQMLMEVLSTTPKQTIPEYVTKEQYLMMIKNCLHLRTEIAIGLMFQNGLRSSEVLNIKTNDYNAKEQTIIIRNTKNHNDYIIYLTDYLADKINQYIDHTSEYLLHTSAGNRLIDSNFRKEIKNLCIKSGFPKLHCHSFRHGSAMQLLDNNINLFLIKEHLRHSSITSTQRYLHINKKAQNKVQSVFAL